MSSGCLLVPDRLAAVDVLSLGTGRGSPGMVDHAGIRELLEDTISADEIRTFKPSSCLYRHAAGRTGTPIDELLHVSAAWFDVMGARHAGMQTAWVDRTSTPWEPFGSGPHLTIETFHDLASALGA